MSCQPWWKQKQRSTSNMSHSRNGREKSNQGRKYALGPQRVHDGAGQEEASPRRGTRRHWMQSNVSVFH